MKKAFFTITFIILANLLVFLTLWLILDALLETNWRMKIYFLLMSIPSLIVIMWWKLASIKAELYDISQEYDTRSDHNN